MVGEDAQGDGDEDVALDYLEELVVVRAAEDAGNIHAKVGCAEAKCEKYDSDGGKDHDGSDWLCEFLGFNAT